jgi:hypothetical protein
MRGNSDGERRGFSQCRRGGGCFSLRSEPAAEQNLNRQDAKNAKLKNFLVLAHLAQLASWRLIKFIRRQVRKAFHAALEIIAHHAAVKNPSHIARTDAIFFDHLLRDFAVTPTFA